MGGNTDTFFGAVMSELGSVPPTETMAFFNEWALFEGTGAKYNPLASEWKASGSTNYNSAGVQNYPSISEGVSAIVANLQKWPEYAPIIAAAKAGSGFTASAVLAGIRFWGTASFANALANGLVLENSYVSPALPASPPAPTPPAPPAPTPKEITMQLFADDGTEWFIYGGSICQVTDPNFGNLLHDTAGIIVIGSPSAPVTRAQINALVAASK